MIYRKIWIKKKRLYKHQEDRMIEMRGWFLFGVIPLFICEYQALN